MLRNIILGISVILFILAAVSCSDLYKQVRLQKVIKEDHAAINMVTYGIFDIQLWKRQALAIFKKQIEEYEVATGAYQALDIQLRAYLNTMYKRYFESGELLDLILERLSESGSINKMFMNLIQKNLSAQIGNLNLQREIPGLSAQLVNEIRTYEPQIKAYFQQELLGMLLDDVSEILVDRRRYYYQKYNFNTYEETDAHLANLVSNFEKDIKPKLIQNIILLIALLALVALSYQVIGFKMLILGLTLISVLFLLLGVTLPMIDIDARLNAFNVILMGEPISFDEQVIYFQTKSILDVTKTLWQGQGFDLKLVGALVFSFSVVFPFTKLVLSAFYLFSDKVASNRIVQNVIFHLGKWSMADVFVVAMFMAYIGFYGIVTSQLTSISHNPNGYAVETLNYSKLAPGALYFTLYCLLSIVIGIVINRHSENATKKT